MNIGIQLDKNDFMYDVHSLVKGFFPDDSVSIFTVSDIEKCQETRDLLYCVTIPEYSNRKEAKDQLKRNLYEMLSDYTGKKLPWGTLSGIRPTKIPMKCLEEQMSEDDIIDILRSRYFVSEKKIHLALEVAENERTILGRLPHPQDAFSLYLDIPFCPSICLYCTFSFSPVGLWKNRSDEYLSAMIREMQNGLAQDAGSFCDFFAGEDKRPAPQTIYIGGGTPTSLDAIQLDRLLSAISDTCSSRSLLEYTVEAGRPDSITEDKLKVLKAHGVNRISINPQTMNQKTLDLIGRKHTVDDVRTAFSAARKSGFDNINMDIILGLPGEDEPEVQHTLDEIKKLDPDSLTVHSLAVKRASRLTKELREEDGSDFGHYDGLSFINSEKIIEMAYTCARSMGMSPYYLYRQKNMKGGLENTGFARPGRECLYNILIMEELQEIKAFGAGASSKTISPEGRIERKINPKDVKTYLERFSI